MADNFDAPQSRNEAILQNMLGAENELAEPQSRVEELLIDILNEGAGLPDVTQDDDGKVLAVVDGEWDKATIPSGNLPPVTSADDGKVLGVVDGSWAADDISEDFAQPDGYYENMSVGNAEQLIASVMVEDKEPYSIRTSGGSADIGNRVFEKVIGGTLAWNQLIQNGNFASADGWSGNRADLSVANNKATLTMPSTTSSASYLQKTGFSDIVISGHKYLVSAVLTPSKNTSMRFGLKGNYSPDTIVTRARTFRAAILTAGTGSGGLLIYVNRGGDLVENDTCIIENVQCFDLTQMFGTTIADNIAALETSNAGDGVNWFKGLFPKEFYAYNAGQLMSVKAAAHKTIGFNLFNKDNEDETVYLIAGNQYQVSPYEVVQGVGNIGISTSDGNHRVNIAANGTFTPIFSGIYEVSRGAGVSADEICIHLTWSGYRNGEYEEYKEHTYPLDTSLTLRGVPKLDANNNWYYDGDEYASDGTVNRRFREIVLDGTTTGRKIASNSQVITSGSKIYAYLTLDVNGINTANGGGLIADKFITKVAYEEGAIYIGSDGHNLIMTNSDQTLDTAAEWNAWLASNNVTVVYEVADPTSEEADPFVSPQVVDDFGMEEYIDYGVEQGARDVSIPVGHDSLYPANLRDKLQRLPNLPSANGDYIVRYANRQAAFVPYEGDSRIPSPPVSDGSYRLVCTVADGEVSYSWESEA